MAARKTAMQKAAAVLGRKGGKSRVANLTPEQLSKSGAAAARARWDRVKKLKEPAA